jgi:signal transduction histidine kinase
MAELEGGISIDSVAIPGNSKSLPGLLHSVIADGLKEENLNNKLLEVINIITDELGADHGYITLKDQTGQLVNAASASRDTQDDTLITLSNAVVDKVIKGGKGIVVNNVMQNDLFAGDPNFQRFNIKTVICAAIKTPTSTFGAVYCDSRNDCQWDETKLEMLELAGLFTGLAINNIQLFKKCEENKRLAASGQATLKMSHSVKNILQMVSGAAEVMDFGLRTNEIHRVKRSWDILKPNLERLRKFTMDMLDYSKERKLELGPCDFNRVLQGAIESLKSQLKQKKSKLNIRIDQKIPTIELDSERIHEMALNLILNAIDIVDENTGIVSISTKYSAEENTVELSVMDNGPGMTEEMKGKIFEPFESDKNKFGTGLGMPIAKQVIDQHDGRIEIETQQGKGTTFRVILPAKIVN